MQTPKKGLTFWNPPPCRKEKPVILYELVADKSLYNRKEYIRDGSCITVPGVTGARNYFPNAFSCLIVKSFCDKIKKFMREKSRRGTKKEMIGFYNYTVILTYLIKMNKQQ